MVSPPPGKERGPHSAASLRTSGTPSTLPRSTAASRDPHSLEHHSAVMMTLLNAKMTRLSRPDRRLAVLRTKHHRLYIKACGVRGIALCTVREEAPKDRAAVSPVRAQIRSSFTACAGHVWHAHRSPLRVHIFDSGSLRAAPSRVEGLVSPPRKAFHLVNRRLDLGLGWP